MSKDPFISIIIVCYNYGHLLPRALEAISRQDYKDYEIVFVDNGCTDNSLQIMKDYSAAHLDTRTVFVKIEKNIGLPYGDNKGVEAASGKYLMFHDADDWMDDNALQLLATTAIENDADRVISAFRDVNEKGEVLQIQELGEEPNYWLYCLVQGNLFRADLYKRLGIKTETNSPDMEKTYWFSSGCGKVSYVFQPCYNMLIHNDSTSRMRNYYKSLLTDYRASTVYLISLCCKRKPPKHHRDYHMAVYALTRLYYSHIFRFLRYAPLKDTLTIYSTLNKSMRMLVPDYMSCTATAIKNKKATRPYGRRVALLAYNLERYHLMKFALIIYHFLSKKIYFNE